MHLWASSGSVDGNENGGKERRRKKKGLAPGSLVGLLSEMLKETLAGIVYFAIFLSPTHTHTHQAKIYIVIYTVQAVHMVHHWSARTHPLDVLGERREQFVMLPPRQLRFTGRRRWRWQRRRR